MNWKQLKQRNIQSELKKNFTNETIINTKQIESFQKLSFKNFLNLFLIISIMLVFLSFCILLLNMNILLKDEIFNQQKETSLVQLSSLNNKPIRMVLELIQ